MAYGESPYDYLSSEFRTVLEGTLKVLPSARQLFERGEVVRAEAELRRAGHEILAAQLDLMMPYKFSG